MERGFTARPEDTVAWSKEQAHALRAARLAGTNLPIDWDNVAEEIEALGKSQARDLENRSSIVLVHLMKLQASPAAEPRAGWRETIREQRDDIDRLLADSPSLRRTVPAVIERELDRARHRTLDALSDRGEEPRIAVSTIVYAEDQALGPWLPGDGLERN